MSLETKCLLKAFQLHYYHDNDAKSMVKHLIFLRKFAVLRIMRWRSPTCKCGPLRLWCHIWRVLPLPDVLCGDIAWRVNVVHIGFDAIFCESFFQFPATEFGAICHEKDSFSSSQEKLSKKMDSRFYKKLYPLWLHWSVGPFIHWSIGWSVGPLVAHSTKSVKMRV